VLVGICSAVTSYSHLSARARLELISFHILGHDDATSIVVLSPNDEGSLVWKTNIAYMSQDERSSTCLSRVNSGTFRAGVPPDARHAGGASWKGCIVEERGGTPGERDYRRAVGSRIRGDGDLRAALEECVGSRVDHVTLGGRPDLRLRTGESTDSTGGTWREHPESNEIRNSAAIEKPNEEADARIGAGWTEYGERRPSVTAIHSTDEWA